jgi:hypothetical protein
MTKTYYIKELNIKSLLKIGSTGEDVKKVQEWLNLWRYHDREWYHIVTVDGEYGPQSEKIIKLFQKKMNLEVDGVVGVNTFRKLSEPMANAFSFIQGTDLRKLIVQYAGQHLENMPRELCNSNKGPWVRAYMDGNEGKVWAWCMGFVQTVLDQAFTSLNGNFQSIMPKTYSCDVVGEYGKENGKLIRNASLRSNPEQIEAGDIFLIVKEPWDWTHTGIVTGLDDDWIHTIEGNTNDEGLREGFEVCRRMRNFKNNNIDIFKVA